MKKLNTIVWTINILKTTNIPKSFDFDYVASLSKNWEINLYIFWETEIETSKKFMEYCEKELWKISSYDFSISSEDNLFLDPYDYEAWIYELATFEWEQISFWEIKNRFEWSDGVISIREAELSNKFGNRVIKVDFVY
jgi:hypothetical protein